ncbi:MAG: methyltransferase domain-containing protein [Phycisphaera sp.]|nr:methyltransferase domain-containing protein [Phycisphaera sp.]
MQMAFGYSAPLILETAVVHGYFDTLAESPKTADDVAAATGTSPRGARVILTALVSLELLARDDDGRYRLTAESDAFLVSGRPAYRGGIIRHTSTQLIPRWMGIHDVVRTGRPVSSVNQQGAGAEFFEQFVESLFPMSRAAAAALAGELRIAEASDTVSVLDIAAGSGVWSITLAEQSPHVRVTAVDWPGVIPVTKRVAERQGVADRVTFVEGDLKEADFGSGHHVATLGHILHSEGEQRSRDLVAKVHDALAPGGTIAIAEWIMDDDRRGPAGAALFAVNMLVNTDEGDTFTFAEMSSWLADAGFVNVRLFDAPSMSPLILADRA